jgi:predicted DNA-binding transcriptional regulator YafY
MPPIPAGPQVRRLLVMVPWLVMNTPISLAEVAEAFGISRKQAEADVLLAGMIGVPPYGGGDTLEIWLDGDMVHSAYQPILTHPPQFTPQEGLVVLASGRALLGVTSASVGGPLASALAKLEAVLGRVPIAVDLQVPPLLDQVRAAVEEGWRLRIHYYAAWSDDETDRDIEPHVVHERNGRWYVEAFDHLRGEMRRFRVDRIHTLVDSGERFVPVRAEPPPHVYTPPADAVEVVLDLPASARWVVESYPVEWVQDGDRLRVTMRVVGDAWLERLLLRVGPEARVVSPVAFADVGARAARRLLECLS